MDYFTKWPEAYPLPNHEAATVAGVLVDEFFARFGVPHELHSDQGREFESAVFRECCQLLGVKKTRTTPLRPQSDGMVERYNRTLGQELAKYCQEGQEDWDLKIPLLLLAYRSAEHEVTGYTPARLMCGRELRLPVDLVTGRPPDEDLPTTVTQYATALQDRLREVHHQVRGNLKVSGEAMKDRYDRRATAPPFSEGDQVISDVTFRIRQGPRKRALVVHADRLWGYHGPGNFSWGERAALLTSDEEEDEDGGLGDEEPLVMEDDGDLDLREPEPLVMEEGGADELCPLEEHWRMLTLDL
ncbi:protein NYNRIN-like [Portunus trituberculatus]|uniref:protein NYNRIN-like n=1 Tax=Portunus trituberculatus TaxID=210409 RepID=UPI001E1CC5AE|nr:protein NYNRIN-like [Portunus trituberculatus]